MGKYSKALEKAKETGFVGDGPAVGDISVEEYMHQEEPGPEVLADLEVPGGETLFGAYFGTPHGERSVFDTQVEPDRIVIYKGPLEDFCETVEELIEEIEITVVHEVAHHFGIEDEVLARYGYG